MECEDCGKSGPALSPVVVRQRKTSCADCNPYNPLTDV